MHLTQNNSRLQLLLAKGSQDKLDGLEQSADAEAQKAANAQVSGHINICADVNPRSSHDAS